MPKQPTRERIGWVPIVAVATAALVSMCDQEPTHRPSETSKLWSSPLDEDGGFAETVKRVEASVLRVAVIRVVSHEEKRRSAVDLWMSRGSRVKRESDVGSAIVLEPQGLLLTSAHLIAGAETLQITVPDGREVAGRVVAADDASDIALVQIEESGLALQPIEIGNSQELHAGDIVLSIGNPFDVGQSVSMGIVSAKERSDLGMIDYEDFIQTDAALNPGSSGGALVDAKGRLVGMNAAVAVRDRGSQGIAFAVPSAVIADVVQKLRRDGRIVRGWIGIEVQELSTSLGHALGSTVTRGLLVSAVALGGPSDDAGLRPEDIIVGIDDAPTSTPGRFRNRVAGETPQSQLELKVVRGRTQHLLRVTVGAESTPTSHGDHRTDASPSLGLELVAIDPISRSFFSIPEEIAGGLIVAGVDQGSPGELAGLMIADVIVEVDRKDLTSGRLLNERFDQSPREILLRIYRNGHYRFLALHPSRGTAARGRDG